MRSEMLTSTSEMVTGTLERTMRAVRRMAVEERGATTAEYAVVTLAAVGIAGTLVAVLRGDQVRALLTGLVDRALTVAG